LTVWDDPYVEPEELADAIARLTKWAQEHAPEPEPAVRALLREHLGGNPAELPIVTRPLADWDRPNFQVAIDEWAAGREIELVGLPTMHGYRAGLAELARGGGWVTEIKPGPVEHVPVPLGDRESVLCVKSGFWLVNDDEGSAAVMLKSEDRGMGEKVGVEVMAPARQRAERIVAELTRLMRERNVYRGRVLELGGRYFHDEEDAPLSVRTLPQITRDRIVLPDGVLERIERQAFGIAEHAERLRASGRHLRRGLLLHGPPGTGKTLTAMYLAASMPGRTVVLLTGQSLGAVGASIDLATALQPAMVVLEDVDLVAMDRDFDEPTNAVLFELLNGMDGLDEDHDVLFVLTTNRADLLEPALAARPGRIDQAVELPLPDAAGRRRLIALYGEGLDLGTADDRLIADLDGVSPAFIRELLRRAALVAAEESDGALRVTAEHLRSALEELRTGAGELTNTLLGARPDLD
jgi:hypothetical protein